MPRYEFSENNSGGSWWLTRRQYEALFASGWTYEASDYDKEHGYDKQPFFKKEKNLVPYGWRKSLQIETSSIREAVENWEEATGENFFAEGCNCCGSPFSISRIGDEEYEYISGDSVERTAIRPW